ncbi:MAG: thiamine phosphate synthase [Candidatus Corynebacterium faecigallinarum]|uniref:thiamine phosphate synthase n=1 Tax=Candidatus Corynebacterium faecigallinarum TaxID=2838528 RepID=UPI003FD056B3
MDHRFPGVASSASAATDSADRQATRVSRVAQLEDARLYLCTPARALQGDLRDFLHAAYDGGVDIIQLRDKGLDTSAEIAALEVLAEVAREHGKLFAVNDRADVAALVGADVFHVGQDDLTIAQARTLLGPEVLLGLSTHSLAQARAAMQDADLDYFCTGPLWETPTKPGRAATGLELVSETAAMLAAADDPAQRDKVWFTIGGVNVETLPQVQAAAQAGAHAAPGAGETTVRAVVVRPITGAVDPRAAAAELTAVLR